MWLIIKDVSKQIVDGVDVEPTANGTTVKWPAGRIDGATVEQVADGTWCPADGYRKTWDGSMVGDMPADNTSTILPVVSNLSTVTKADFLDLLLLDREQDALISAQAKAESASRPTADQLAARRLMFHFSMVETIDLTRPKLEELILAISPLLAGDWRASQILAGREPTASNPNPAPRKRAGTKAKVKAKPKRKAAAKTKVKAKPKRKAVAKPKAKTKAKPKTKVKAKTAPKTKTKATVKRKPKSKR